MRISVLFLLLTGLIRTLSGQSIGPGEKTLAVSIGLSHHRVIDEAFTARKLKFSGTPFMMALDYEKKKETRLFMSSLQGSFGSVSSITDKIEADFIRLRLAVSCSRKIGEYSLLGVRNKGYLGGQLSSANYGLSDLSGIENVTVTFYHTLDLCFQQHALFNDGSSLRVGLMLPVIGFVKRSVYDGGANQALERDFTSNPLNALFRGSKLSLLSPLTLPQVMLSYSRRLSSKSGLLICYHFHYLNNKDIEPIRLYANGLSLGLKFDF